MVGGSSCEWRYEGSEEEFKVGISAFTEVKNVFNVETSSISDSAFLSRNSWMFADFLHRPESFLTMSHHLLQSLLRLP